MSERESFEFNEASLSKNKEFERIDATSNDVVWIQDPSGYFTIAVFYEAKQLVVRHYTNDHKPNKIFYGTKPNELYSRILKEGLVSRMDHAAYLGKELQKAFEALQQGVWYEQDSELDLSIRVAKSRIK